jgi:hypothetical protein
MRTWLPTFIQDVQFGARTLLKSRGVTLRAARTDPVIALRE